MTDRHSVEEMCRAILRRAIDDGLVEAALHPCGETQSGYMEWSRIDPNDMTAEHLAAMANLLSEFLDARQ